MRPTLQVGLYASPIGALIYDFSPLLTECEFATDEHGFADCHLFAALPEFESNWLFNRPGLPDLRITDNGVLVWQGRLEDPDLDSEADPTGIALQALGYYRSLSDLPYTATHTSVTANTIVAALLPSAPLLSASTALIQSPGVTISESYDDKFPAEILDRLTRLGDSATPPRVWEAGVWEGRRLHFRPRGEAGRDWYVDASRRKVQRTLQTLINSAYGVYNDATNLRAVTATSTDTASVNRWGVTRREAVKAQTRSSTLAAKARDMVVEDGREPAVRAEIEFDELFDAAGARWPLYSARSGDTITLRNLPLASSATLNRIRTFTILQTRYDAMTDRLRVTPESPLATLAEQLSGGPGNSPSKRSSPLGRLDERVGGLEQEVHGGPGGGGGGSSGGSYLVPTGAIVAFATACPAGWSEYTAARGRVIVGTPAGGTAEGTVGSALTNLGTRTISTVVAHTHPAGTLSADNESAHTHGVGTYDVAAEAAHTHGDGTLVNSAEAVHIHSVNPPNTISAGASDAHTHSATSGNESVGHTHSGTSGAGSAHDHTAREASGAPGANTDLFVKAATGVLVTTAANINDESAHTHAFTSGGASATHTHGVTTGTESIGHTHDVNIAAFDSAAGSSHNHTITGNTAVGTSHDHALSGNSGAGSAHGHNVSGATGSTGTATVDVTMPYIQLTWCQKD